MKTKTIYACALALACATLPGDAIAGFDVPDYVFGIDRLDAAKKEAKDYKKGITFMYSDSKTTCPLATSASQDIIRYLKEYTVIVYLDHKAVKKAPALVKNAFTSSESGKYIPKAVVTDVAVKSVIVVVPYARGKEHEKSLKEASRVIEGYGKKKE